MGAPSPAPTGLPSPGVGVRRRLGPLGALLGGAAAAAVLLRLGGGAVTEALPGLPYAGPVTPWALPASRYGGQAAAVVTVGLLLAAVALAPRDARDRGFTPRGYRLVPAAGWAALVWAACSAGTVLFTISDLLGRPASANTPTSVLTFVTTVDAGTAHALSFGLALVVFLICRITLRPRGAAVALGLAVLAVVPPVFTGHAAGAGNHQLAVSGLLLHVVPVTLWAGGLLALVVSGGGDRAVRRFSPLATACLLAVGLSGVLAAAVRIPAAGALTGTAYGRIVLLKAALTVLIALAGLAQRRAAMPALRRGDRGVFGRVAAVELLLFGLAIGAATALARTPAPVGAEPEEDLATSLLGFGMPEPLTAGRVLGDWLPDPLFLTAAAALAGLYLAGVRRLRRRGDAWAGARVAALLGGVAVLVLATSSGLARYAPVLFSVHMVQHLLLGMVVPILLALSAPLTLALRALRPSDHPAVWPGPRELLLRALKLPVAGLVARPPVALAIYVAGMYVMYFSGLFELALRSHAAHLLMVLHFLGAGYLFFWVVIGVDPAPRPRPAPPLRILLVLVAMALHAFLGVAIMQSRELLAGDWFTTLPRTWGASHLADQQLAGGIAWSFGELPTVLVIAVLVAQWIRADEREQRRIDRKLDREMSGPRTLHPKDTHTFG